MSLAPNDAIGELAAVLGHEATREIVRLFLDDFPGSLRQLRSGAAEDQLRIAHGMKSSALHMGAHGLSARMAAIEGRLEARGGSLTEADISGAAADFEATAPALRAYAQV